jgi:ABC-type antimicrobial peptide transport system permease subunit
VLEWPMSIPSQALVIAPAFSIAVGIFFGFYPARRAHSSALGRTAER